MIHLSWYKLLVETPGDVVGITESELRWSENGCKFWKA